MPSSWRAKTGRPWWPDWVMRAIPGPSRSSRNVEKAFRLVLGPSSRIPDSATAAARRSCAAAPSSPVSAKPEAKTTANFTLASASCPISGRGSATSRTARSICSGRSATDATQGMPKTEGRVGCTGCSRAPTRPAQSISCRVTPVFGRPSASEAPITATDSGRKKRSRSGTSAYGGRPPTSRSSPSAGRPGTAGPGCSPHATTRARRESVVRVPWVDPSIGPPAPVVVTAQITDALSDYRTDEMSGTGVHAKLMRRLQDRENLLGHPLAGADGSVHEAVPVDRRLRPGPVDAAHGGAQGGTVLGEHSGSADGDGAAAGVGLVVPALQDEGGGGGRFRAEVRHVVLEDGRLDLRLASRVVLAGLVGLDEAHQGAV